jgi:hypothetical protein
MQLRCEQKEVGARSWWSRGEVAMARRRPWHLDQACAQGSGGVGARRSRLEKGDGRRRIERRRKGAGSG